MRPGVFLELADPDRSGALFQAARADGFDSCQLHLGGCRLGPDGLAAIGRAARAAGVRIEAVSGYANLLRPAEGPFGFTEGTLTLLLRLLPRIGATRLVTWSGTRSPDPLAPDPENGSADAWRELVDRARDLLAHAAALGLEVLFEPHHAHVLGTPEAALRFLDALAGAPAALVLDPVTLIPPEASGERDARTDRIVAALAPRARLVHFKDLAPGTGGRVEYPASGRGLFDHARFARALRRAGWEGPGVVEHVTPETRGAAAAHVAAAFAANGGPGSP
jgi:sugar phosphate isomerase/epimerase